MSIAIVTDSNAQMPRALLDRFGIRVVPLTIVIDGTEYHEGVDLDSADFYTRLAGGATVSTAAPSPGAVLTAYEAAIAGGADEILSIHIGANTSATLASVAIAARLTSVPVSVVDTGTASFGVGCCVWAAAECLAGGGTIEDGRSVAARVAAAVGNVFVVGSLGLARAGGRLSQAADSGASVPVAVLALEGGQMLPVARAEHLDAAVDVMANYVEQRAGDLPQRIGVGDALDDELAAALVRRLGAGSAVGEIVRYEVGPSVGAHTGAGTVGAVFAPVGI